MPLRLWLTLQTVYGMVENEVCSFHWGICVHIDRAVFEFVVAMVTLSVRRLQIPSVCPGFRWCIQFGASSFSNAYCPFGFWITLLEFPLCTAP